MARRPASLACGVLGNGLSPISSSTTSLPRAFSRRAIARTVKAVSACRPEASALSRAMDRLAPSLSIDLSRRDGLGQRSDHLRDHEVPDHLLAELTLAAE